MRGLKVEGSKFRVEGVEGDEGLPGVGFRVFFGFRISLGLRVESPLGVEGSGLRVFWGIRVQSLRLPC